MKTFLLILSLAINITLVSTIIYHNNFSIIADNSPPVFPKEAFVYGNCTDCTSLARSVAWSIDNHPEEWSSDRYRLKRGKVGIWIANGEYGLAIGDAAEVKGNLEPGKSDRLLIYTSVNKWLNWKLLNDLQGH